MNNQVTLVGRISSEFTYDHTMYGENYYRVTVSVERTSGTVDNIPVMVSDRLINTNENYINTYVGVKGQYRSYNLHELKKTRLLLFVFATQLEILEYSDYVNDIYLEGTIVKPPIHRYTPYKRELSDVLLSVHRAYGKCDYIPCICWGRSAKYAGGLKVGDNIRVSGRLQSRDYDNKAGEHKTAYEVSVSLVEEC